MLRYASFDITPFDHSSVFDHNSVGEDVVNHPMCRAAPRTPRLLTPLLVALVSLVPLVPLMPGALTAQQGLGFEGAFGYQAVGGDYGDALKGGIDGEFVIVYTRNRLRYGVGVDWASYTMEEPNDDRSWSNVAFHLGLAYFILGDDGAVRPFVEGRMVGRRLRPEGEHFGGGTPEEPGENTSPIRVFGISGAALAGVEIGLTRRSWVKLAGYWGNINTDNAELGEVDLGTFNTGSVAGFRVGIFWTP